MLSGGSWWGCWDCCTWTWTWTGQSCRQVGMNIFKKRFFLHQILANDWTSGSQLSLSFLLMTLTGEVGGSTSRGRSGFSPRFKQHPKAILLTTHPNRPHIQIDHTSKLTTHPNCDSDTGWVGVAWCWRSSEELNWPLVCALLPDQAGLLYAEHTGWCFNYL